MEQTTVNGRYRIERAIGEGGMAEVYLGHDLLLNRAVAVKTLRSQYANDPGFRARFEREAQAAAGFTHPNIIDIFDVGEEDGTPYIVMEFVAGENLKEIIDSEGPFEPDDVASLIEQVAAALDYAHERGLVHRDIKPQNILVDEKGLAKVVDFGIAKGLTDGNLTEVGTGLGTVHYISPEQASGLMATPSSDIYSLAIVAFEMLTLELPYDADTAVGVAMQHIQGDPPHPSDVRRELPRQVGDIVIRGLAKDPTRRFASAGEFAESLTSWRTYPSATTRAADGAETRVVPPPAANGGQPAGASTQTLAAAGQRGTTAVRTSPGARASRPVAAAGRDEVGCATWLVGLAVVIGLAAFVYFGFQLAPRLSGFGDDDPTPGPTAVQSAEIEPTPTGQPPTQVVEQPAAEPTSEPPIVPRETEAPELIIVPDLTGETVEDAAAIADELGLSLEESGTESSDTIEEGRVVSQDPPPDDEVEQGSAVSVMTSSGPAAIDLAALDLVGRSADEAQQMLEERSLAVAREETASTDIPAGAVVAVEPPDEVEPGDAVTLIVSIGDQVRIPADAFGQSADTVVAQLEDAGLVITDRIGVSAATIVDNGIDMDDAGVEDGDVVGVQDNGASFGVWLPRGMPITLVVYDATLD